MVPPTWDIALIVHQAIKPAILTNDWLRKSWSKRAWPVEDESKDENKQVAVHVCAIISACTGSKIPVSFYGTYVHCRLTA